MKSFPKDCREQFKVFKKLNTPVKIQNFLDTFAKNFEKNGDTLRSPLETLKNKEAHCFEGALLAAAALWYHGARPLLLDLKATRDDDDHVVALFCQNGLWGAISKTNHPVLRYRDPIFKSPRELALSYFNEYFLNNGKKTLRSYSTPFDLSARNRDWLTSEKPLWTLDRLLEKSKHFPIVPKQTLKQLRKADKIEIIAFDNTEWKE